MNPITDVKRYLQELSAAGSLKARPFVTISRQAGAGGRSLANELVRQMKTRGDEEELQGWRVYDEEICEKIALDPDLKVSFESLLSEEFREPLADYLSQVVAGDTAQIKVYREIFSTVRALAKAGKAVIVGRGGSALTRRMDGGVHIRLVAPPLLRAHRMMETFSLSKQEAERWIAKHDDSRARMMRSFFNRDIEDPMLYDAVFNTGSLDLPRVAAAVIRLVEEEVHALRRRREVDSAA